MNRDSWNERPVTFAEFSIREGKAMLEAFSRDGEEGSFALLVLSLRYADTGERGLQLGRRHHGPAVPAA